MVVVVYVWLSIWAGLTSVGQEMTVVAVVKAAAVDDWLCYREMGKKKAAAVVLEAAVAMAAVAAHHDCLNPIWKTTVTDKGLIVSSFLY